MNNVISGLQAVSCYIFLKSTNLTYCEGNDLFLEAVGIGSNTLLNGRSDYDMPWGSNEIAKKMQSADLSVLEGNNILNFKEDRWYKGNYHPLIINKLPLRDKNDSIIGILGFHYDINNAQMLMPNANPLPSDWDVQNKEALSNLISQKTNLFLKKKEIDCLALWINGYSIKESAFRLNLSYKTIEAYRSLIKEKFNVHHKFQLIDLTHANGTFHLLLSIAKLIRDKK